MLKVVSIAFAWWIIADWFVDQLDKPEHLSIRQWRKPFIQGVEIDHDVEVVDQCVYLVSWIDAAGVGETYTVFCRRIKIKALERNIWRSRPYQLAEQDPTVQRVPTSPDTPLKRRNVKWACISYDVHLQWTNQRFWLLAIAVESFNFDPPANTVSVLPTPAASIHDTR